MIDEIREERRLYKTLHGEDTTISRIDILLTALDSRDERIENAFREGHRDGYGEGLSDGHPLGSVTRDEDGDWEWFKEQALAPDEGESRGKIFASCGHQITADELRDGSVTFKDEDREGNMCDVSMVVCPKCRPLYEPKPVCGTCGGSKIKNVRPCLNLEGCFDCVFGNDHAHNGEWCIEGVIQTSCPDCTEGGGG